MDNYNKQTDVAMEGTERWGGKSFLFLSRLLRLSLDCGSSAAPSVQEKISH